MNRLAFNALFSVIGRIALAASQWFILIALARVGGPADTGLFILAVAISTPLFLFFGMQLRQVQAVDAADRHRFSDYMALRAMLMGASLVAVMAVSTVYDGRNYALLLFFMALARMAEGISEIYYGLFQKKEKLILVARSNMIRALLFAVVVCAGYLATAEVFVVGLLMALCNLVVLVAHDVPAGRPFLRADEPDWRRHVRDNLAGNGRRVLRALLWRTLPMGFAVLLVNLHQQAPRYMIEAFLGIEQLGLFASVAYLIQIGGIAMLGIGQAFAPALSRLFVQHRLAAFVRLLGVLVLVNALAGLAIVAGGYAMPDLALRLVYGPQFASAAPVVGPVMLAGALSFLGNAVVYGLTAMQIFRLQPVIQAAAGVGALLVGVVTIPRYGMTGGAWSIAAAHLIILVASSALIAFRLRQASSLSPSGGKD